VAKSRKPRKANIPSQNREVLDQAGRTLAPLWKNLTDITIALIAACGAAIAAAVPHWLPPATERREPAAHEQVAVLVINNIGAAQQFDCVDAREKAINIVEEFPDITPIPYTGAEEDQCHLNEVVQRYQYAIKHAK
jgi:hypothetical protein